MAQNAFFLLNIQDWRNQKIAGASGKGGSSAFRANLGLQTCEAPERPSPKLSGCSRSSGTKLPQKKEPCVFGPRCHEHQLFGLLQVYLLTPITVVMTATLFLAALCNLPFRIIPARWGLQVRLYTQSWFIVFTVPSADRSNKISRMNFGSHAVPRCGTRSRLEASFVMRQGKI